MPRETIYISDPAKLRRVMRRAQELREMVAGDADLQRVLRLYPMLDPYPAGLVNLDPPAASGPDGDPADPGAGPAAPWD